MADRSGFIEGTCDKCKKPTFSKGKVSKHKCKGRLPARKEGRDAEV